MARGPWVPDGESTPTRARAGSISEPNRRTRSRPYGGRGTDPSPRGYYGCVTPKPGVRSVVLRPRGWVEARRADPARLGHVHRDPVGGRVLDLDVRVAVAAAHAEGGVDVLARRGADRGQLLGDLLEALDLEAEVMDAGPVLAALDTRHRVVLELEDGEVQIAVGEVETARVRVVDLAHFFHAEHVDVELRGGVGVGGGERDVLDLRHGGGSLG